MIRQKGGFLTAASILETAQKIRRRDGRRKRRKKLKREGDWFEFQVTVQDSSLGSQTS
uniref:Uncharacterized protein n=1 Tax=Helianthus annuus TaxID=4232 RepID=A0A251TV53_HELAN